MPVLGHFIIPLGGQGTSKKLIGSERGYKTRENFESGGHRKYFKAVKNSLGTTKAQLGEGLADILSTSNKKFSTLFL